MRGLEAVVAGMTLSELARLANTSVEQIVDAAMGRIGHIEARPHERSIIPRAPAARARRPQATAALRVVVPVYAVLKLLSRRTNAMPLRSLCEALGHGPVEVLAALQTLEVAGQVRSTGRGAAKRFAAADLGQGHTTAVEFGLTGRANRS